MNRPLVIALAVTLPVIAYQSYQNGKLTTPEGRTDTATPDGSADTPVRQGRADTPVHPKAHQAASLKSILASTTPTSRLRALFDYAESVPAAEIGAALEELRATTSPSDPEALITAHILLTR